MVGLVIVLILADVIGIAVYAADWVRWRRERVRLRGEIRRLVIG